MADWHLARAGQTLGIYPEDQMRAYYAEGRVAPGDLVWTPGMAQWLQASLVFGAAAKLPPPPKLHWGWVLLVSVLTAGLFYIVWAFVQAVWVRRVDPRSNAVKLLVAYLVLTIAGEFLADGAGKDSPLVIAGALVSLGGMVAMIVAYFSMRRSLLAHYNEVEPVGLTLSWWMTLLFNVLYLQHHLTRIAKWKQGGAPAAQ
jgi:hypothetical protein